MSYFICPVCAEKHGAAAPALNREGAMLRCEKGHSFDISSKGYVNLLLSQHKNTKDPGDSKAAVPFERSVSAAEGQPVRGGSGVLQGEFRAGNSGLRLRRGILHRGVIRRALPRREYARDFRGGYQQKRARGGKAEVQGAQNSRGGGKLLSYAAAR